MAEEKTEKKTNGGLIAGICIAVAAAIAAVVAVVVINVTKPNIVGSYTMTAILDSDGNESSDAMEMFKALGANYAIEFKEDKTGTLKVTMDSDKINSFVSAFSNALTGSSTDENGDVTTSTDTSATTSQLQNMDIPFTYDDKKITLGSSSFGSSSEMEYDFKDGAVIITVYGQKMKFTK